MTTKHRFLIYNNTNNNQIHIELLNNLKSEFINAGYLNDEISICLASEISCGKNSGINTSAIVITEIKDFDGTMAFKDLDDYFKIPYKIDVLINASICLFDIQYLFNVPYYEYNFINMQSLTQTLININS